MGGNTDYGNTINCQVITGDKIVGDRNRYKIFHRDLVNFTKTDTNVQVATSIENNGVWNIKGTYSTNIDGQFKIIVNQRAKRIRYKYNFPGTNNPEIYTHEQFF
jgi:hypothetical protein